MKALITCFLSLTVIGLSSAQSLFLTPAVSSNITQYRYYECNSQSGSGLTQLQASSRVESDSLSCNVFSYNNLNVTYNIRLNNESHEIHIVLNSYTVSLNGNSIFMRNGMITSGPCEGGHLDELTFGLADDQSGCLGKGLAQVSPVYATLRISGGKCEAECSGGITTIYDPPIVNSSNDIQFKNCADHTESVTTESAESEADN